MGFPINGDLVPSTSGFSNLGVDVGTNGQNDFGSILNISPFGHIHLNSGVFHHPTSTGWESGVVRFNSETPAFEVSTDGGITFLALATGGTTVTSVGVIGGTDIAGDVDFSNPSGFIVIGDTAGASPITWNLDVHALSGLWGFPTNGFDTIPTCYSETFSAQTSVTANHALNTLNVIVQVYNNQSPSAQLFPDRIVLTDVDNVTFSFNVPQTGHVVIMACENS